jgi:hypothetical protein
MPASPSSLIASLSAVPAGLRPPELTVGLPAALARVPRSTRSPRYLRRIVRTGTSEGVAVLEASLTWP